MGGKITIGSSTDALQQTCAGAVRFLAVDRGGFSAILTPMTQLAAIIGKLNGQHIRVKRLARTGEIDTQCAPNSEDDSEEKPKQLLENFPADSPK